MKNSVAAAGVVSNYYFFQHFLMQIFDLLCEMKGNTISKDVNKTALNFDLFETNHTNMSTRWWMIRSKPIFITFIPGMCGAELFPAGRGGAGRR